MAGATTKRTLFAFCALLLLCVGVGVRAGEGPVGALNTLPEIEKKLSLEQKLGAQLPPDLQFTNEQGQRVALRELWDKGPVLLSLVYYECPSLCGMVMGGVFRGLSQMKLKIGKEFQVVFVSINPEETTELAAKKKAAYVRSYLNPELAKGVHFLVGGAEAISQLASTVGFTYHYDEKTRQYAHPGAAIVITPEGKISRYHLGVEYVAQELRLSLVDASGNKIGNLVDHFMLYCYRYDPTTGKYGLVVFRTLKGLGLLTIAGLAFLVFWLNRREKFQNRRTVELKVT